MLIPVVILFFLNTNTNTNTTADTDSDTTASATFGQGAWEQVFFRLSLQVQLGDCHTGKQM